MNFGSQVFNGQHEIYDKINSFIIIWFLFGSMYLEISAGACSYYPGFLQRFSVWGSKVGLIFNVTH